MTRVKISGAVLLILLAVSTFAGIWVNRRCDGMLRDIDRLSTAAENLTESGSISAAGLLFW